MDDKHRELARYRMNEAESAGRSGEALLQMEDFRGAINRFYYAAFYATQALLILKGKDAKTHSGTLHLFREEFIRNGPLPEDANKILSSLFDERMESDYTALSEPSREEAVSAQNSCKTFLKQAKGLFDALL